MNKCTVYGLYDTRAGYLCNVFISMNDATAKRSYLDLISSPYPSLFTSHYADFNLVSVCSSEGDELVIPEHGHLDILLEGRSFSDAEILNMRLKRAANDHPDKPEVEEAILNESKS